MHSQIAGIHRCTGKVLEEAFAAFLVGERSLRART